MTHGPLSKQPPGASLVPTYRSGGVGTVCAAIRRPRGYWAPGPGVEPDSWVQVGAKRLSGYAAGGDTPKLLVASGTCYHSCRGCTDRRVMTGGLNVIKSVISFMIRRRPGYLWCACIVFIFRESIVISSTSR